MKQNRLAWIGTAVLACGFVWQCVPPEVQAAQQSKTAGAETSPPASQSDLGARTYMKNCSMCHGPDRQGHPPGVPSLVGVKHELGDDKITAIIHSGRGGMPPFPGIKGDDLTALLEFLGTPAAPAPSTSAMPPATSAPNATANGRNPVTGEAAAGQALFQQNCAFCHGRDAMGGETGPDLTQSKLVLNDKTGEHIAQVVREGRTNPKMPAFTFSNDQMASLIAFIHARIKAANEHPGGRRGVTVADLQTGNAAEGKAYFNGAGGCSKCHSATGDLAGIASRLQGLQLEMRMLYPRGARGKVTVTLPSGQTITGKEAYRDEFTIALTDADGVYHSWPTDKVKFTVDSPADAHVEQFPKYTDDDIHNLMAYLQTLK